MARSPKLIVVEQLAMGRGKRTGWCCLCEGESTEAQGGSASVPLQASAWYGKTCGSVRKKKTSAIIVVVEGGKASQWPPRKTPSSVANRFGRNQEFKSSIEAL